MKDCDQRNENYGRSCGICKVAKKLLQRNTRKSAQWRKSCSGKRLRRATTSKQHNGCPVFRLTNELAKVAVDRTLFDGLEKERDNIHKEVSYHLFLLLHSPLCKQCILQLVEAWKERDSLSNALSTAKSDAQQLAERLQGLKDAHMKELEQLIQKNSRLSAANRQLRDQLDEAQCEREVGRFVYAARNQGSSCVLRLK